MSRFSTPRLRTFTVPFRGGTLEISADTSPGALACIAQIALADPKIDAFYRAVEATVEDLQGNIVWPEPEPEEVPEPEQTDIIDLLLEEY